MDVSAFAEIQRVHAIRNIWETVVHVRSPENWPALTGRRRIPQIVRLTRYLLANEVILSLQRAGCPKLPSQNQSPENS